jgi:hypothetical protein
MVSTGSSQFTAKDLIGLAMGWVVPGWFKNQNQLLQPIAETNTTGKTCHFLLTLTWTQTKIMYSLFLMVESRQGGFCVVCCENVFQNIWKN